jgi:hypothetical protein
VNTFNATFNRYEATVVFPAGSAQPSYISRITRVVISPVPMGAAVPPSQPRFVGFGGGFIRGRAIAPPIVLQGAIQFAGTATSYLALPAGDADFQFGTGDFTIEWFQFITPLAGEKYPRIFALGTYPTNAISFSLETAPGALNNRPTLYIAGTQYAWTDLGSGINNVWRHVALTRSSGAVRLYVNGVLIDNTTKSASGNIVDGTNQFTVGNESTRIAQSGFSGYITNINVIKGTALYTGASLTVPTAPLTANANSKLLLLANSSATLVTDSSSANKTVTNVGTNFVDSSPFA